MTDAQGPADSPHARRIWPQNPGLFTDVTVCPACFTSLRSPVCSGCGLDLSVPRAYELLAIGQRLVQSEEERQRVITRMRAEQVAAAAALAQAQVPAPAKAAPTVAAAVALSPAPRAVAASAPPAAAASAPLDAVTVPRRSSVQVLLLTLGVVLVSVAAAFFLFIAYVIASVEVRAVMTALASVLVFGVAWMLRVRRLRGTAEGIAIVAIVLLLLDVWLVRANGLFGSGDVDASIFTGMSLLILSLVFLVVDRVTGLRVPGIAWASLAPIGIYLLVLGVLLSVQSVGTGWTALGAVGVLSLTTPLLRERPTESTIIRVAGFLATSVAIPAAIAATPGSVSVRIMAFLLLSLLWIAILLVNRGGHPFWHRYAAMAAGLTLVLAVVVPVLDTVDAGDLVWVPATCAAALAVLVAALARYSRLAAVRRAVLDAFIPIAAVAALAIMPALVLGAISYLAVLTGLGSRWRYGPLDAHDFPTSMVLGGLGWGAVLAPLCGAVLLAAALWFFGRLNTYFAFCVALLAAALLSAGALSSTAIASVVFACAAAAAIVSLVVWRTPLTVSTRVVYAATGALAVLALCSVGFSSTAVWPFSTIIAFFFVVLARMLVHRMTRASIGRGIGAFLSGGAAVIGIVFVANLPEWLSRVGSDPWAMSADGAFWTVLATAATLAALAVMTPRILPRTDAAALSLIAGVALVVAAAGVFFTPTRYGVTDSTGTRLITLGVIGLLCVLWQLMPRSAGWPQRVVFAAAAPIGLALFALELTNDALPSDAAAASALPLAAIVAAALAFVLLPLDRERAARLAWDAATVLVSLVILVTAVAVASDYLWLCLLLLALVPLLLAAGHGGVFRTTSAWRHVAWLSLPLAVAGLWSYLGRHGTAAPEPYSLPVAGLLAVLAVLVCWRRSPLTHGLVGRNALATAAAALAVLPSVFSVTADAPARPIVLVAVGAALLLVSPVLPHELRGVRLPLIASASGAVAALGAGTIRSLVLVSERGDTGFGLEGWILPGVAAAAIAASVWALRGNAPRWAAESLVVLAIAAFAVPEAAAILSGEYPTLRLLITLGLLGATHIGAVVLARAPLGRASEWVSLAVMAVLAFAAITTGHADPFEFATVPLAIALGAAGFVRLDERDSTGSWAQLGPATAVLLVPSLLADFGPSPLWRVITLGIIAIVIVIVAVLQRLQAPLLIAAGVLVVHAIAQLWPWISAAYEAVQWWLWLGIGGVILIVLAATYEKRIRDVKAFARSISSLR